MEAENILETRNNMQYAERFHKTKINTFDFQVQSTGLNKTYKPSECTAKSKMKQAKEFTINSDICA